MTPLTTDDAARLLAIAARHHATTEHLARAPKERPDDHPDNSLLFADAMETWVKGFASLPFATRDDVDYLLALVTRLTQGQARDEANIGIPF